MNNNYFDLRNINPIYYNNFRLPGYIKKNLPLSKDLKILDIGCGFGQTLSEISKLGYKNIYGIDISNQAVDICCEKGLNVEKINNIVDFAENSDKKYDFIIMSHVLEHIDKSEIIKTLSIIRTKLIEDGGKLCIIVPNAQSSTGSYWMYEDFTHTTLFTSGSIYYVLKAAGFKDVIFLDVNGLDGSIYINPFFKVIKIILLKLYNFNKIFWNLVTSSSYHRQSLNIYSFELKVLSNK